MYFQGGSVSLWLMKKLLLILGLVLSLNAMAKNSLASESTTPPIFIKAINPGYTVDGEQNVGEFIELGKSPDVVTPFSLAGLVLSYTNSSGNSVILYEFPAESWMTGESILLRLASSSGSELADLIYSKTLALKAGPLMITQGETIIDSVCWTSKEGCLDEFKSATPTTIVRDLETNEFSHLDYYEPSFTVDSPGYQVAMLEPEPEPEPEPVLPHCQDIRFSEIYSYYESDQSEQFIELKNVGQKETILDGCEIKYKGRFYPLTGTVLPGGLFVRELTDFALTKNPIRSNLIEIIDVDGSIADSLTYYAGQKKAASLASFQNEAGEIEFQSTYNITPGAENIYQKYHSCEEGKVINETTGNCVKQKTTTTKTCEEGYYLNEETGRCRKITQNTGADYPPDTTNFVFNVEAEKKASLTAICAIIGVIALGLGFVIFEFRFEIKKFCGKVFQRVRQIRRRDFDHR